MTEAADLRLFAPERWADVRKLVDRLDSLTTAERAREPDAGDVLWVPGQNR